MKKTILIAGVVGLLSTSSMALESLSGLWSGYYEGCGQGGKTNAQVFIYPDESASFRFNDKSNSSYREGFDGLFAGEIYARGSKVKFRPTSTNIMEWFQPPNNAVTVTEGFFSNTTNYGWRTIGFSAVLSEDGKTMNGSIDSKNCPRGKINLSKYN